MAQIGKFAVYRATRLWAWTLGAFGLLQGRTALANPDGELDELRALQRAAVRQAHVDERTDQAMALRLRLSALLPQLRASVGRGWQWDAVPYSTSTTVDGDHFSYTVAAQWDLGRLFFAREDVALRREAQQAALLRTQLRLKVARIYGWRCHAEQLRETSKSEADASRATARMLALDIALAALIGDDHASHKVRHCSTTATGDLGSEVDALIMPPPLPARRADPDQIADLDEN